MLMKNQVRLILSCIMEYGLIGKNELAVELFSETYCTTSPSTIPNKTLGRALDPRANGTWLSKLTE